MITHQLAMPTAPRRVAVLGASGFIGSVLLRHLNDSGIDTLALGSNDLDLCSPTAVGALSNLLRPTDSIVMLSALTPDKGRDIATFKQNLTMMETLNAAIAGCGCVHFVYFSSDAVYGSGPAHVSEATSASPTDLYGAGHLAREIMVRNLPRLPALVLRPTLVFGSGDTHNAYGPNRFIRTGRTEERILLFGAGEETRDHIHVDDVAQLTLRCLQRRTVGTLNVATGRSLSFHDVANLVAQQFSGAIRIVATPRVNSISHRHYDVTNTIKAFPDFRFTEFEDGIASLCRQAERDE